MKRAWMFGAASAILFSIGCTNQKPDLTEDFSDLQGVDEKSDQFSNKMKLLGSLDYGQTSPTVKYHNPPKYRAYKFGGQKGDQVIIDVASANGDSFAWLTDNAFKVIAKNDDASNDTLDSHIEATLPANKNPDIITYYIIFSEYSGSDASFHVSLKKKQFCVDNVLCMQGTHWDATQCKCVKNACVDTQLCIQGSHWDSTQCKCVSDHQFCGGIAGIQCPPSQKCVDDPNDNCDPNNGGRDCGGICVACVQNQLCVRGSHWDSAACSCVPDTDGCATVRCASGTTCVNCFNGPACLTPSQVCAL